LTSVEEAARRSTTFHFASLVAYAEDLRAQCGRHPRATRRTSRHRILPADEAAQPVDIEPAKLRSGSPSGDGSLADDRRRLVRQPSGRKAGAASFADEIGEQ